MNELPEELKTPNEDISFVLKGESGNINGGITANIFWHHMHVKSSGWMKNLEEKVSNVFFWKRCSA